MGTLAVLPKKFKTLLAKGCQIIEDLRKEDYNAYGFMSEKDYKERLRELDADIFALESDIELIENLLKEESQ